MTVTIIKKPIYKPKVGPLGIDKIAVVFDVPAHIKQKIKAAFAGTLGGKFNSGNYQYSCRLPGNKSWSMDTSGRTSITFQAGPKGKLKSPRFCRVEFTPTKVETFDVAHMLEHEFGISYQKHVLAGRVTRLDVAVDINDAEINELLIHAGKFWITKNYYSSGRTVYIGGEHSALRFVAYDKVAEIKDKNSKTTNKALHVPVPSGAVTRVEARVKPKAPFSKLPDIDNPLLKLRVSEVAPLKKSKGNDLEHLFLHLARVIGVYPARMGLSKQGKEQVEKYFDGARAKWWLPAEFWKQYPARLEAVATP